MSHEANAYVFFAILALSPVVWCINWRRRNHFTFVQSGLYLFAYVFAKLRWRVNARPLPIADDQAVILVCNHCSSVDPFFVQTAARRVIHWMVARDFCDHWLLGWIMRACEVIPVSRSGADTAATKMAIRSARNGEIVGMFPEGRINMTDQFMLPVRPGVVLVALKTGTPILPCYIEGSPYRGTPATPFFMTAKVTVHYGELIDLTSYKDRGRDEELQAELTRRIISELARLAGREDFEPRLAGRKWKPTREELERDVAASRRK